MTRNNARCFFNIIVLTLMLILNQAASAKSEAISNADGWSANFNGHARTMVESYRNYEFGLAEIDDDAWVHQRVQAMLSLDYVHRFTWVTELSWGDMWGRHSPLGPPDRDEGDILQLYAQARLNIAGGSPVLIRAGRQTLYYGSGRLLSKREGANQQLAHDALLFSWQQSSEGLRVDAFVASPVETKRGLFDNTSHADQTLFWSLYAVMPSPWHKESSLDLYYIGLQDEDSIFAPDGGHELRHSVGIRWWDETGPWIRNTEAVLQFGKIQERNIFAGAFSFGMGRVISAAPLKPTLMLRADVISGGDDEGTVHTFHPLFQANNYFNEGGFISPTNLYNINPVLILQPHSRLSITLGVNFQWRFSADDAIYAPPLQPLDQSSAKHESSRYLGTAFNAAVTWQVIERAEISLGCTHHEAGASLAAVGGRDVDYFQAAFRLIF